MSIKTVIAPGDVGRGLAIVSNKVVTDCPDNKIAMPGASAPSDAVVQAYLATLNPTPLPGTLLTWGGTATRPDVVYVVDHSGVAVRVWGEVKRVGGQSALVINPTTGANSWANGATQSTPIATLPLTNPSANNPLVLNVQIYHGVYFNLTTVASPKTQTISGYSLVNFDNGGGTLQSFGLVANGFGSGQIAAQATQHDTVGFADAGSQNASTLLATVTVPAGGSVTLRVQSTLTIRDGNASGVAWSYCQVRAEGMVSL